MYKKKRKKISEKKLFADLMDFDEEVINDILYLKDCLLFIEKAERGEVDKELHARIKLAACDDRKHLKGDYCILLVRFFLKNKELKKTSPGKFNRHKTGKKFKATEGLVKSVFRNHQSKDFPVKQFCKLVGISRNKYYRIINQDVEDIETIRYLKSIQKQIENE